METRNNLVLILSFLDNDLLKKVQYFFPHFSLIFPFSVLFWCQQVNEYEKLVIFIV